MKLMNDLLIRAARGESTERTPVWLMRQAGRILPEYRKLRKDAGSFKTLVNTPDLASEVTIQPVEILGVDAAIIFSDILVLPEAMGLPYEIAESKGPWFGRTVENRHDIEGLKIAEADDLSFVLKAIEQSKKKLAGRAPLIGFAGAPWTIFAYMIEGTGSKTFSKAKKFLYCEPALSHKLLEKITLSTIHYLKGQIAAGADIIQVFDSWAGVLSPVQYREFSQRYINLISEGISEVPVIVFAKGAPYSVTGFAQSPCDVIGMDWTMNVKEYRTKAPNKTLQGNLDPCVLYAVPDVIKQETEKMLTAFGPDRHICNLGHGLYPDTEKEKVKFFVDTVKNFRHHTVIH